MIDLLLKCMPSELKKVMKKLFPSLYYYNLYRRSIQKLEETYSHSQSELKTQNEVFDDFLRDCEGKRCLQIGVKEVDYHGKFGEDWISVDKYDKRDFIDYNDDVCDLRFEDESFDRVVCWSILEHVPDPRTCSRPFKSDQ